MAKKRAFTGDDPSGLNDLALSLSVTGPEAALSGVQFTAQPTKALADDNMSAFVPTLPPRVDPDQSEFREAHSEDQPAAPGDQVLTGTITGITFDENGANNAGSLSIPPDPHGAVGPNHVVSVVNTSIEWHTKDGTQQNSQSLKSFFGSVTNTFDPKVIYDQHSGRFIAVTLEQSGRGDASTANDVSNIYVAVSDDSNPNGTWHKTTINAVTNIGGNNTWADYPGIAVDNQAIYITNNMFRHSNDLGEGQRLWIINKGEGSGGLYDGGAAGVTVHNPIQGGAVSTTLQPAHIYGDVPGAAGTFLVAYSGLSDGTNEFLEAIRVDNPLGATTFTNQFIDLGNIENTAVALTGAPQLGTTTRIDTNDRRALNAVWRDNALYVAATVNGTGADNNQATAFWAEVNTSNLGTLALTQAGTIGGEQIAAGTSTFFPSIAVAADGDVGVGFSASAPSIYAGSYFAWRDDADPLGTMRSPITVHAGEDFYIRTFSGTRNRWGDYTATVIDPSDNDTFWTFNEYAMSRGTITNGTQDGRWATVWGHLGVEAGPTNQFVHVGAWTPNGNDPQGWYIGDFNGDGRDDILRYHAGVSGAEVFGSTGVNFVGGSSWTGVGNDAQGWYVGDFNGDNRDDIFRYNSGVSGAEVLLSTGSSFASPVSWTGAGNDPQGWYVGDFNGDGKDDILRYHGGVSGAEVFTSNGSSFVGGSSWTGAGNDGKWYVGDFNGDGKSDIFRTQPGVSGAEVFLSNGAAFVFAGSWTTAGPDAQGWYVGDFNKDGKDDILRHIAGVTGGEVFLSNGTAFISDGSWTSAGNEPQGWYVGDFNGGGAADIFRYSPGFAGADMFLSPFV